MSLRPLAARWFELVVPRRELARALAELARTGAVELHGRDAAPAAAATAGLVEAVAEFRAIRARFGHLMPTPDLAGLSDEMDPAARLSSALQVLREWSRAAEPTLAASETIGTDLARLEGLRAFLADAAAQAPRLDLLGHAGPRIAVRLLRLPAREPSPPVVPDVLQQPLAADGRHYLLLAGETAMVETLERSWLARHAESIALPPWLPAEPQRALEQLRAKSAALERHRHELLEQLARQSHAPRIEHAAGEALFAEWFLTHVPPMALGAHFAWITGWCRGGAEAALRDALDRAGVASLVHWPAPPAGLEPPVTLGNPRWARPFEVFVRLIGMPAAREADPSQMLALIAPLLFGFMFGDVGQGAVLLALGLALQRRHPPLALLTGGGLASIAFGFAFGSVFGREDLVEPIWIRPLAEPLTLLAAALLLGVLLVGGGLLVDAASLLAAGLARDWWRERAGLLLAYAGGVLAAGAGLGMPGGTPLAASGGVLAALGLVVTLAGSAAGEASGRRLATAAAAVGRLLEAALQLAVNTVSFLRVGAFALAHAGLSLAIVALAATAPRGLASLLVLALGNAFVIVLEAAVAGIQTTRLVLFEFFSRFLRAGGRAFVALPSLELSLTDRRGESM